MSKAGKRTYKPRAIQCDECGVEYVVKARQSCKDGKFRCPDCRQKFAQARAKKAAYHRRPKHKLARRKWALENLYGLSLEGYDKMLERQGGVCSICKRQPEAGVNLAVDHDHQTGKVRGLLCQKCNRSIGSLGENLTTLRAAISYLLRHDAKRSWDRYFLDIAELVATRSKDPSTQVGAVIVRNRAIVATGYNGFPRGVNDSVMERYDRPTKYFWTIHAEENAIFNAARTGNRTLDTSLYLTPLYPCEECAKAIAASGIREVIVDQTMSNPRWDSKADYLLRAAGVLVRAPE